MGSHVNATSQAFHINQVLKKGRVLGAQPSFFMWIFTERLKKIKACESYKEKKSFKN